ncbi:MAG: M15 family metallopeptidase [Pseudomonadota bacterium]
MQRRTFIKHSALFIALVNTPFSFASTIQIDPLNNPEYAFDFHVIDRLPKKRLFNKAYDEDIFLDKQYLPVLNSSLNRLKKLQRLIGYGHFCLLNFDDAIKIATTYPQIGEFSKQELDFFEMIFYSQGKQYGFMGEKPIKNLTGKINIKEVKKICATGNYLYQGKPMERYYKIKKEVGNDVILTSGVRSIMKQFLLFLNKTADSRGNLSMASRSLAPPGYSFHGVGDFDVGQKGYGVDNFTEHFTQTPVYKKLINLGYIKFRYEQDNDLGVRFEPWHIEVI